MRAVTARAVILLVETIAGFVLLSVTTEVIKRCLHQAAMLLQR